MFLILQTLKNANLKSGNSKTKRADPKKTTHNSNSNKDEKKNKKQRSAMARTENDKTRHKVDLVMLDSGTT